MIIIKQEHIDEMYMLMRMKQDNAYIVLNEYNGYSTICQYTSRYDNLHIVNVKTENLKNDSRLRSADD